MDIDIDAVTGAEWQAPGVRLTHSVMAGSRGESRLPSAIPVFIGWFSDAQYEGEETVGRLVPIATWEQWPWERRRDEDPCLQDTVRHYFDNGGGPCFVLLGTTPPETLREAASLKAWWLRFLSDTGPLLLGEPSLTLVAVPQLVGLTEKMVTGADTPEVHVESLIALWQALLRACISRSDLFFVLDAPAKPAIASVCINVLRQTNALGDTAPHAALYGPHLVTDYRREEGGGFRVVPPCGAVLGVYGRTDATEGVWKAPANEPLQHVVKPEYRETLARGWFDVGKASINLIRSFAGRGTRVWGCRTLSHELPFRYVQIRRTVSWVEANLKQICRFAVFEPNNEITWFQVRGLCRAWLRRVWLEGGLAGADEASAYSVRVGLNESMTQADIDAGRLIVQVGVSVLHAAEIIEVILSLSVGGDQGNRMALLGRGAA